jgi:osmoprotectant transport system permease protein
MVAYTGDVWSLLMKRKDHAEKDTMRREVIRFLEDDYGVVHVGALGFETAYAVAVTGKLGGEQKVKSIADLARYGRTLGRPLRIAGDIGIFHRKEWDRLREWYGFGDVTPVEMDQSLTYAAVANGEVDAIIAYSSDGRIKAFDLRTLKDPAEVFAPYDALLLVSRKAAERPGFVEALRPLVGSIDQAAIQEANRRVDVDGQSPQRVGRELAARSGR